MTRPRHSVAYTPDRPIAVDLFCGCGGLTEGLRQAGFEVRGAADSNPLAAESFLLNHPSTIVWTADLRELEPAEVYSRLELGETGLDLLAGCPPCQGFSRIRTLNRGRSSQDHRNSLLMRFGDFVEELNPRLVLMENVPGLEQYYLFRTFLRRLRALGYETEYRSLDAAEFGVPQRRRRLVLAASKDGAPIFPEAAETRIYVEQAIRDLPVAGHSGDPLHDLGEKRSEHVMRLIRQIPKDGGSRSALGPDAQLACHKSTDGFYDVYGRMAWRDVAPTLTTEFVNPSKGRFLHPEAHRAITIREGLLLQSFPADYQVSLARGKFAAASLVGNAFPPEFVRRHAVELRTSLSGE